MQDWVGETKRQVIKRYHQCSKHMLEALQTRPEHVGTAYHLMNAVMSSSLCTARPFPRGREANVTRGRLPPENQVA